MKTMTPYLYLIYIHYRGFCQKNSPVLRIMKAMSPAHSPKPLFSDLCDSA